MEMTAKFQKSTFSKHLKTMLHVDFRWMFTMPLLYFMVGACLVIPILVMTTMMDGSVTANPQAGVETVIEVFDSTWQIIISTSTVSNDASALGVLYPMAAAISARDVHMQRIPCMCLSRTVRFFPLYSSICRLFHTASIIGYQFGSCAFIS